MIVTLNGTSIEIPLVSVTREVFRLADNLPVRNNRIRPTLPFLRAIAKRLKREGLECDSTAAWQFWQLIVESADAAAQESQLDAEIAWAYHIDPTSLPELVKLGLERNIERNRAKQRLANGDYSPTDYEGIYHLVLLATGDEAQAERRKTEAFKRFVEQQTKRGATA